jgi:hypothetical protein
VRPYLQFCAFIWLFKKLEKTSERAPEGNALETKQAVKLSQKFNARVQCQNSVSLLFKISKQKQQA